MHYYLQTHGVQVSKIKDNLKRSMVSCLPPPLLSIGDASSEHPNADTVDSNSISGFQRSGKCVCECYMTALLFSIKISSLILQSGMLMLTNKLGLTST